MTKEKLIRYGKDYLHDLETACCPISDIHKEFVREAIKALEIVEEFEKAQIITGGRLNGRTYAYKCGLEDGKRKSLEQQPCDDCVSLEVYKQVTWERDIAIEQLNELGYGFGEKIRTSDDCVSRQAVLDMATTIQTDDYSGNEIIDVVEVDDIKSLPPVTPTHGKCKDCKHYYMDEDGHGYHCEKFDYTRFPVYADFYCADFEKRGNENEED